MREEFEKLAIAGKIGRQHMDVLVTLATNGYCLHRSWGVGKITTVDTVFSRFLIDFHGKSGHQMDLTFAANSLKPIPAEHILARKLSDLHGLRQTAALHHLDLIKTVLQSYGGKATLDQVQQVLVPDVITSDWKKWWEVVKAEMKKDGHFQMPLKKTAPIVYQAQEVSLDSRLLQEFKAARGLKSKLVTANEALKNIGDLTNKAGTVAEIIATMNSDIISHQRTQTSLALEAIFLRDELRVEAGLGVQPGEIDEATIWSQILKPAQVLDAVSSSKQRRALQSFKNTYPDTWAEIVLAAINVTSSKLCGECSELLIHEGRLQTVKDHFFRLIAQHQASAEMLFWLGKERSDTFADILGPEVFRAMLTAMERDQFNERRSNKLRDFILSDPSLMIDLIGSADLEIIKDLTRALQLSPCFDDMDKRSLLARIVKSYPAIQILISGDHKKEEITYIVSWPSLERRKNEYAEMVQKKIPANSKEIAIARSYGDLRENHEYKAAKEMQKLLMRRKGELEQQLVRARGTDFANPRTDAVSLGTTVKVTDINSNQPETYTVFGAWDSEVENNIISYLTPLAQALLNKGAGEEVTFDMDGVQKRYRIDQISTAILPPPAVVQPVVAG
ncbi:MAG: hypothetical protein EXS31_06925 [Pedosphaera sp.]|nr:hypothetical protein [Pedosphaera sp.]